MLRRAFILLLVAVGGLAQIAQACTVNTGVFRPAPPYPPDVVGFVSGSPPPTLPGFLPIPPTGSISGASLPGGLTITALFQIYDGSTTRQIFVLNGFLADPGKSYFTSLSFNGRTDATAGAGYAYSQGSASWIWVVPSFQLAAPASLPCTVNF